MSPDVLPGPSPELPRLEPPQTTPNPPPQGFAALWSADTPRLKLFLLVFLPAVAVGMGLVWLRTPIYQATATLEIRPSDDPAEADGPVDPQFLMTQVQNITGRSMLEAVVDRLGGDIDTVEGTHELNRLEDAIRARAVKNTALVKVNGLGDDPRLTALLVNTLVDVYGDALQRQRLQRGTGNSDALERQSEALAKKIAAKQEEVDQFKERYDITSTERAENDMLSRMTALAADRDKAVADLRLAEANFEQVRAAIGSDEAVLLDEDRAALDQMAQQINDLQVELKAKGKVYTKRYMALDPQAKEARETLVGLRKRWADMRQRAQEQALIRARQERDAAEVTLNRVELELDQHKAAMKQFTSQFQRFQNLVTELEELNEAHQEVRNRLTREQINRAADLARMEVLERAGVPSRPVPDQSLRYSAIVMGGGLVLALFAVWLIEFLTRNKKAEPGPTTTVSVNLGDAAAQLLGQRAAEQGPLLAAGGQAAARIDSHQAAPRLASSVPVPVLNAAELQSLWESADADARLLLALLLNGVGPDELALLQGADLNLNQAELGVAERIVPMSPMLRRLLSERPPLAADERLLQGDAATPGGADALLNCAAIDAGLQTPGEVDAPLVQRSYLAWLVGQGVRLSELKRVAGDLRPAYLASFAPWSPKGPGYALEDIEPFLPCLSVPA